MTTQPRPCPACDSSATGCESLQLLDVPAAADAPMSGRAVEDALKDTEHGRDQIRAALRLAKRDGSVLTEPGAKNAVLHYLNPSVRESARECAARTEIECASAPIEARTHSLPLEAIGESALPAHTTCPTCDERADDHLPGCPQREGGTA